MRAIFALLDADGDGGVSRLEFVSAVRECRTVEKYVLSCGGESVRGCEEARFDAADEAFDLVANGKRRITFQDFAMHFRRRRAEAAQKGASGDADEAQDMFQLIDIDRSGAISKLEFVKALQNKPMLERFLLTGLDNTQLMSCERSFDSANAIFKTMACGRKHVDLLAFRRYCQRLGTATRPLPQASRAADRACKRVFVIGAGFRQALGGRQVRALEAAGFQVAWCDSAPAPSGPGFPVFSHLEQIRAEMDDFAPDVLLCGSVGGLYALALWRTGQWTGPTVLLGVPPGCPSLPQGMPVVLAHGANDAVFPVARAQLEALAATARPNTCLLYYSANSGRLPSGHLSRVGDAHEMESLLQHDCLPRLVDSALSPEGPELHLMRSWRGRLAEIRSQAEQRLGFTSHAFRQRWLPPRPDGARQLLVDVPPSSEEWRCVAEVFKAPPREPTAYAFANSSEEKWAARPIVRVQRVENSLQEDSNVRPYFAALQQSLEGQGVAFEPGTHTCWAFHGAAPSAIESVVTNPVAGFQPLASGTRGASLWGLGTYFARDARYVADGGFCGEPSPTGTYQMLMCLLATGIPCLGDPQHYGVLPFRVRPHRYNSSVDSLANPEVIVIQHPGAALPGYLITFA